MNDAKIVDEISLAYQTATWGRPAKLTITQIEQTDGVATIEARMLDPNGVTCLDAVDTVRFGLAGDGYLLDNLGTSTGSRVVQLYNGYAQIKAKLTGQAVACVMCDQFKTAFLDLTSAELVNSSSSSAGHSAGR